MLTFSSFDHLKPHFRKNQVTLTHTVIRMYIYIYMAINIFGCRKNALGTLLNKLLMYSSCSFVQPNTNIVLLNINHFWMCGFQERPKQN